MFGALKLDLQRLGMAGVSRVQVFCALLRKPWFEMLREELKSLIAELAIM